LRCKSSVRSLRPQEHIRQHYFPQYRGIIVLPRNDEVEVKVNLRPTVSRPVCLGVRRPSGTCDRFFFLFEISFRQLCVCYFVAPSLARGRVCKLLYNCFWALPEQSLLGPSPEELTTIFYCLIWDSPNLEGQVRVYIPQEQGDPVIPPGTGFPFCRLSQGLRWRYSNPPPHGEEGDLSTISYIGIQFVPHMKHISFPIQIQPGHWGPITVHYRLIWDCVPFMSPLTTRREYGGGILTCLHTRSGIMGMERTDKWVRKEGENKIRKRRKRRKNTYNLWRDKQKSASNAYKEKLSQYLTVTKHTPWGRLREWM
jgi:hypothetical protein